MLRGRYSEAGEQLQIALKLADGTFAKAEIRGKLGELDFKQGKMADAALAYEEALPAGKAHCPESRLHCFCPTAGGGRPDGSYFCFLLSLCLPAQATAVENKVAAYSTDHPTVLRLPVRAGEIADVHGTSAQHESRRTLCTSSELAHIYSGHSIPMTLLGLLAGGSRTPESLDIRRSLGDLWGEGQTLSFYGSMLYSASRLKRA